MVASGLRTSRIFRSFVLTVAVFSLLLWIYIVLRIVVNDVDPPSPFLPNLPFSVIDVGAASFALSALATFVYLWLWGRFDRGATAAPYPEQRSP